MMGNDVKVTWLGTNSLLVESPKTRFLVDPFVALPGAQNANDIDDFLGAETIFVTHGHFDHIVSIRDILAANPAMVLCTDCVKESLKEDHAPLENVVVVEPGSAFEMDDVTVRVLAGKHIEFDLPLVAETLAPRNLRRAKGNVKSLLRLIRRYPEEGQTVVYDMDVAGKSFLFMGSLALREGVEYPRGVDYLVMPYQGSSNLEQAARTTLEALAPRNAILSHFDDAFPPVSKSVPLDGLRGLVESEFPDVRLTIPRFRETIAV